jgi:hypothetical protein
MTDQIHYDRLVVKPERESYYAFLLMGFAINDVEQKPPLWLSPVEITQDMAPVIKAYWARRNPILAAIQDGYRKHAIEALRLAKTPGAKLSGALSPEVEALVRDLTNGYRQELKCLEEGGTTDLLKRGAPIDGEGRYSRELCARVIVAAGRMLGSPGHDATAKYINGGLPSGKKGLTRDHVGRVAKSHDKMLERLIRATWRSPLGSPPDLIVPLMLADLELVQCLAIVYRDARTRPEFKGLGGEDLAWAIHAKFDLNEMIHRAACRVRVESTAPREIAVRRASSFALAPRSNSARINARVSSWPKHLKTAPR